MGAFAISVPAADGALQSAAANQILYGWSLRETAGSAATVDLKDGVTGGTVIAGVALAANGSDTKWFGPQGIRVPSSAGVFVDLGGSGTVVGSVWVG